MKTRAKKVFRATPLRTVTHRHLLVLGGCSIWAQGACFFFFVGVKEDSMTTGNQSMQKGDPASGFIDISTIEQNKSGFVQLPTLYKKHKMKDRPLGRSFFGN